MYFLTAIDCRQHTLEIDQRRLLFLVAHFGGSKPKQLLLTSPSKLNKQGKHAWLAASKWRTYRKCLFALSAGKMSDVRAWRKRQQLNNLVAMATELARPGDTVVDFCSGGGHVGIVLAHMLPDCQSLSVTGMMPPDSHAKDGPTQAKALQGSSVVWGWWGGPNNSRIKAGAAFVVSPCCYGFVQNTLKFTFPRSKRFLETLSYKEHMILCRFADQTAVQLPPERRLIGKQCMGLVDLDRSWAAETHGYSVRVMTMEPDSCSPKNNML
ncbi:unnamed protein product, partial [Coregonus sp. 'balchen']